MEELGTFFLFKKEYDGTLPGFVCVQFHDAVGWPRSSLICCPLDFTVVGSISSDFPDAAIVHVFQDVAAGLEVVNVD